MSDIKQVIIVRADLDMPVGKLAGQVAHASIGFLKEALVLGLTEAEELWLHDGVSKKVVLKAWSEKELERIFEKAVNANLTAHMITDLGRTVFAGETKTCIAIGPDYSDKIDPITKRLRLY